MITRQTAVALLLVLSIFPMSALGQTGTTSEPATTTLLAPAETPIITPSIPATPAALSTVAQTRIRNLTANLSNRQDAAVRRLTNVTDRLESRIALMKTAGLDVQIAETSLTEVRANLERAQRNLAGINRAVDTFIGSSNPQENWLGLKRTYTDTSTALRTAHGLIVATIEALEVAEAIPLEAPETTGATTTPAL